MIKEYTLIIAASIGLVSSCTTTDEVVVIEPPTYQRQYVKEKLVDRDVTTLRTEEHLSGAAKVATHYELVLAAKRYIDPVDPSSSEAKGSGVTEQQDAQDNTDAPGIANDRRPAEQLKDESIYSR